MPTYLVTDPETGKKLRLTGDSPPTDAELIEIFGALPVEDKKAVSPVVGAGESFVSGADAALAMGSGIVAETLGGLGGLGAAALGGVDDGVDFQNKVRDSLSYTPRTEGGAELLKGAGEAMQTGMEYARKPASGILGLTEIATGQGLDQAVSTIGKAQNEGVGVAMGDRIMEETGNPELATMARMTPDLLMSAAGLKALDKGPKAIAKAATEKTNPVFQYQSPVKKKIGNLIDRGSSDISTAKFGVVKRADGTSKTVSNKAAKIAIKQGFDEGVVSTIKAASPRDKSKMLQMVHVSQQGKNNKLFASANRPTDVVGNSVMKRVSTVVAEKKKAGSQLEAVANDLKEFTVDYKPAIDQFIADLDGIGVKIGKDLKPIFRGSDIEQSKGAEGILRTLTKRLSDTDAPKSAYDVHRLKKFIDEHVEYGKRSQKGLTGTAERIVKDLRHNLDGILDANFPEYDRVNTTYKQTRDVLENVQKAAGSRINMSGPNANKAMGTVMRKLLSNYNTRVELVDSLSELEGVAGRIGKFDDSLLQQVLFADELDSRFGAVARTSLKGQIEQGAKTVANAAASPSGPADLGISVGARILDKVKGVSDERAYKAIRDLLREGKGPK